MSGALPPRCSRLEAVVDTPGEGRQIVRRHVEAQDLQGKGYRGHRHRRRQQQIPTGWSRRGRTRMLNGRNGSDQPPRAQGQEAGNDNATPRVQSHKDQSQQQHDPGNVSCDQGLRLPEPALVEPFYDRKVRPRRRPTARPSAPCPFRTARPPETHCQECEQGPEGQSPPCPPSRPCPAPSVARHPACYKSPRGPAVSSRHSSGSTLLLGSSDVDLTDRDTTRARALSGRFGDANRRSDPHRQTQTCGSSGAGRGHPWH